MKYADRKPDIYSSYRRLCLDTHVPDWEKGLLGRFEPRKIAESIARAGINYAIIYGQSCTGLCHFPTKVGVPHARFRERDLVGEMLEELHALDIAACVYYCVIFNNIIREHPEWAVQTAPTITAAETFAGSRYGITCPNNTDYRNHALAEVAELVDRYAYDAMYLDMAFWRPICSCGSCADRFRAETGREIPRVVDWFSPEWCQYQSIREKWTDEFTRELTDVVRRRRPGMKVCHNMAGVMSPWTLGSTFSAAKYSDFSAGDFYGDPLEQLMVGKLFGNVTNHRPIDFQTSRCAPHVKEHVQTKSLDTLMAQAFAATALSGAFTVIDGINPDGTLEEPVYELLSNVFSQTKPYEPELGGDPIEEIAVYFSSESKMTFEDNGKAVLDVRGSAEGGCPHLQAVRGACRNLQAAHIPFGIVTKMRMDRLSNFKVVILPNILRITPEEVNAFRDYVAGGGKIYASRYTSLVEVCGTRHGDFLLSDVFGCHFESDKTGSVSYLKPAEEWMEKLILPQRLVSHWNDAKMGSGVVRLSEKTGGKVLATLTKPYLDGGGSAMDTKWISLHSSPPWEETASPVIVENNYKNGTAIYSAADLECPDMEAPAKVFAALIRRLLQDAPLAFESDVHPAVWINGYDQADRRRRVLTFINYQKQTPMVPIAPVRFVVRPPEGKRFTRLSILPEGEELLFTVAPDGAARAKLPVLDVFAMVAADYE